MNRDQEIALLVYRHPEVFALKASGCCLRAYQRRVLEAIVRSIREKAGRTFVMIFARQSGKNELQAQLFAYLLSVMSGYPFNIVSVSPTFKPQALLAMRRLETVLDRNIFTHSVWKSCQGSQLTVGKARLNFLSADPSANVVGATAHLLSVDEAQDVVPRCFAKNFAPMTASTNATRLFWGTAWTGDTLLAQQRRLAEQAQRADGIQRVFIVPASQVAAEVPAYARFLETEIAGMGRDHPIIRSQYFCEEIDAEAGMFNAARLALIRRDAFPLPLPPFSDTAPGSPFPASFAFLLDVAGQDEARMSAADFDAPLRNPGRDGTTLSIVSIDLSSLAEQRLPTYRVVHRHRWIGQNHLAIFASLKSLVETWRPLYIAIDATGVGEGLWALLDKAYPARLLPVKFTLQKKSEIGWRFLAVIETGRFRDHVPSDLVRLQYQACLSEVLPGPAHILRWGVPAGARTPDGELLHDDHLMADSLVAVLDTLDWQCPLRTTILEPSPASLKAIEGHF